MANHGKEGGRERRSWLGIRQWLGCSGFIFRLCYILCKHDTGSKFHFSISEMHLIALPFSVLPLSTENLQPHIMLTVFVLYEQSQAQKSRFCLDFLEDAVMTAAARTTGNKTSSPKRNWAVVGIFIKVLVPSIPLQFGFGCLSCWICLHACSFPSGPPAELWPANCPQNPTDNAFILETATKGTQKWPGDSFSNFASLSQLILRLIPACLAGGSCAA